MSHLCDCRTSEDEVPCVTCKWLEHTRLSELLMPDKLRELCSDNSWSATGNSGIDYEGLRDDLMTLIKGEQK